MSWGLEITPGTIVVPNEAPARILKDHLKAHLAAKYPTLSVGLALPAGYTAADSGPALAVFDDGGPSEWPISDKATLRVTVWSNSLTTSRAIASYALGVSLTHKAEGLSQILPGTRVLDARDTNNGAIMASYTVRTRVRTTLVAEA